ncbi:MAG: cell division protein FtsZ [Bacilli bacterium]|nr:cell division protein FtsZ [Bacilli bacterium]
MDERELDNYEAYARIVVIGVGGAGNNAVNRMIDENISSVEFYVANTDQQALSRSKAKNRIILGQESTGGLGAGGDPEVGRRAAEESVDKIREIVAGANLVFIAAGMGGGTGTGAAPVIAAAAKEAGALTVAIVTRPFTFEGKKRIANSVEGLNSLKDSVDAIIIVSNDKLLMVSGTAPISEAFAESDRVLAQSVKTVTDLILCPAFINLDFADVRNTLKDSGISLIGFGMGSGPNRSQDAANNAINSPLLEASINGARRAICAVTCGHEVSLYEAQETVNRIIEAAGSSVDIKFGVSINDELTDQILVSVIASDFTEDFDFTHVPTYDHPSPVFEPAPEENKDGNGGEVAPEVPHKEEEEKNSFLPNFLKDKNL